MGCPGDLERPGARPFAYLQRHGYPGRIYPVNPRHAEIGGLRAFPSLTELPEIPDVVWIGVPVDEVPTVLREAAQVKAPGAVILTAGFGETDARGRRRQAELRAIADEAGMTVLGPNMLGFINCWDRVPLTFSPAGSLHPLIPGGLGVASQSGALGGIVVNRAFDRRLGVSAMVSTGNEVGITVSECLEYFADDPRTRAVALVVEGIRDGARFRAAAACLLHADKPVVALKVGRSEAGRRNALTHTGALAGSHAAWQAVARQLGIIEVDTFEELVEVAGFFVRERRGRVRGGRVGVITSSGGASIMTADQLEARGFTLPRLAPSTTRALGELLPPHATTRDNPVDVTAGLSEALFERVLGTVVEDPRLDAVVTAVTGARGVERAENVAKVARTAPKPLLTCWLGGSLTEEGVQVLDAREVPCFRNPRTVATVLAGARAFETARRATRSRPLRVPPARSVLPDGAVSYATLSRLARESGIPLPPERLARTPEAAVRAARQVGFPVAVKLVAPDVRHKTETGAVALNLRTAADVRRASAGMLRDRRRAAVEGVLVQRMVTGVEVLVGVTRDPTFGLLLVVGGGGVRAELLAETSARPLPVSPAEIRAMVREVHVLRALGGFRGTPPADIAALIGAIGAVARFAASLGDRLQALDVNPLIAGPHGVWAVDLLVVFAPGGRGRPGGRRA